MEEREWELVDKPGTAARRFRMTGDQAVALLNEAIAAASQAGLKWMDEKLTLKPAGELVELIKQSQESAAKEKGEGEVK